MTVQQTFELAIEHHQAGRLAEAEALYRQILALQPNHADVLHHLGIVAHQCGQNDQAVELIGRAIAFNPNISAPYSNLGEAYRAMGRLEEAAVAYRRAIELNPGYPEVRSNLGNLLRELGQVEEAVTACRQALELRPDFPEAYNNLGTALQEQGRFEEAESAFRRALGLRPGYAAAFNNLGSVLNDLGRTTEAIGAYRRSIELKPDNPMAHNNLGATLAELGHFDEAVACCRRALRLQPDQPVTLNNLGNLLAKQLRFDEAIAAYRRALDLKPDYAEAHSHLGNALVQHGEIDEALARQMRALELKPEFPEAYNRLGNVLREQGRLDEAIASCQRAIELNPRDAIMHSNLLCTLHLHPGYDPTMIATEHRRWHRKFAAPLKRLIVPHVNDRNPARQLRIGYVAAEFRDHVVGRNLLPLFKCHNHSHFDVICYSAVVRPDSLTDELRRLSDEWREVATLEDDALADMIRQDKVDILVDLAQHTADHRLLVFARRPAPLQVSFAGYPASAELEAIEYRITDRYLEGMVSVGFFADQVATKKADHDGEQVYLIDSFWCYDTCGAEVHVNTLPAKENARVTFGCLNTFCKINERVLCVWARVLQSVPGSRLLLLSAAGRHRQRTAEFLEREGVAPGCVEFLEWHPRQEYLELYRRLDIALDPFPYNGHTTSLDALWMGVPVVNMAGATSMSRAGLSILSNLGLHELVAHSEEEYVGIASRLAHDLARLGELRAGLRVRMECLGLMDAPRFAGTIEAAYRTMWRRWCAEKSEA